MLLEKLQNIYNYIKDESTVSNDVLIKYLEYVDSLKINDYVFKNNLIEKFDINENQCLNLLSLLSRENILKKVYRFYCPKCQKFDGDAYESLEEIEQCNECGFEFSFNPNSLKYLIIIFKKTV